MMEGKTLLAYGGRPCNKRDVLDRIKANSRKAIETNERQCVAYRKPKYRGKARAPEKDNKEFEK